MNSSKIPEISIISHDLRQDEVCLRAIQTFEFLDKLIDEVFDRIDSRIDKNRQRIQDYHERIDRASEKIERLRDSKKAIKFSVPSKYPVPGPPIYTPLFSEGFKSKLEFTFNLRGPLPVPETKKPSDKLEFFHLKKLKPDKPKKQSIVFKVKSINSLITFINNENLIYQDPLSQKSKYSEYLDYVPFSADDEDDTTDFSRLTKALKQTNRQDNENFHYFPNMNQAPDFELPLDLPDLAGIAGDIMFSMSDQELIAPSMGRMNIINDLPNVEVLVAEANKKTQEIVVASTSSSSTQIIPPLVSSESSVPPPPPPPAIPIQIAIPSAPSIIVPPPPPPIPAMVMSEIKSVNSTPKIAKPPDDMRSNLMAAIRNAGKSALRSVAAREEDDRNSSTKKPPAKPAGDLMSDLHAKLAMRRRGIAGNKEARKEKASLMEKVSSLIPPPVSASSDDDEESNSNDDWD